MLATTERFDCFTHSVPGKRFPVQNVLLDCHILQVVGQYNCHSSSSSLLFDLRTVFYKRFIGANCNELSLVQKHFTIPFCFNSFSKGYFFQRVFYILDEGFI